MSRQRKRNDDAERFTFGRCTLLIYPRRGGASWVMEGDTRRVPPAERERAAYILSHWIVASHEECYRLLWENVPCVFDGVEVVPC